MLDTLLAALKRHWLKVLLWLLVLLPLLSFVLVNLALLAYLFWPRSYNAIDFSRFVPVQHHAIVLAHGVTDTPASWALPLREHFTGQVPDADLYALDWSAYALDPLRCAIDGSRIGRRIGEQLVRSKSLQSVHLIAHSCGSFVIYNICRAIKENHSAIRVQTTYLDPVSIYGPLFNYGVDHFGDCADYSEAYIDTGDTIRGSNELLPHTHTYDVTAVRVRQGVTVNPHVWPTLYYQQLVSAGRAPMLEATPDLAERKPRGVLEVVEGDG